ncbi:MAG: hypothetical protein RBS39_01605 [Phycisphaerales bacterium]|jgi:hypothetical protein|nr:hypothetical protein [Phycisphaerales bacterium]
MARSARPSRSVRPARGAGTPIAAWLGLLGVLAMLVALPLHQWQHAHAGPEAGIASACGECHHHGHHGSDGTGSNHPDSGDVYAGTAADPQPDRAPDDHDPHSCPTCVALTGLAQGVPLPTPTGVCVDAPALGLALTTPQWVHAVEPAFAGDIRGPPSA